jgi:hypothetical protein
MLEAVLHQPHTHLGALNRALIALIRQWLGITTPLVESHDFAGIAGAKTDMLIQMCQATGADCYLSNEGARAYVDEAKMARAGVQHSWQIFSHPVYPQGRSFQPECSAIDLVFNLGPAAGSVVRASGRVEPGEHTPHAVALSEYAGIRP